MKNIREKFKWLQNNDAVWLDANHYLLLLDYKCQYKINDIEIGVTGDTIIINRDDVVYKKTKAADKKLIGYSHALTGEKFSISDYDGYSVKFGNLPSIHPDYEYIDSEYEELLPRFIGYTKISKSEYISHPIIIINDKERKESNLIQFHFGLLLSNTINDINKLSKHNIRQDKISLIYRDIDFNTMYKDKLSDIENTILRYVGHDDIHMSSYDDAMLITKTLPEFLNKFCDAIDALYAKTITFAELYDHMKYFHKETYVIDIMKEYG